MVEQLSDYCKTSWIIVLEKCFRQHCHHQSYKTNNYPKTKSKKLPEEKRGKMKTKTANCELEKQFMILSDHLD